MSNRVIHFEIHASDPIRAAKFYSEVFGWDVKKWEGQDYWLLTTGNGPEIGINGAITLRRGPEPVADQPVNSHVNTIGVKNYDDASAKIVEYGGTNVVPKMFVQGIGTFGYFKDTEGNIFGIIQS